MVETTHRTILWNGFIHSPVFSTMFTVQPWYSDGEDPKYTGHFAITVENTLGETLDESVNARSSVSPHNDIIRKYQFNYFINNNYDNYSSS